MTNDHQDLTGKTPEKRVSAEKPRKQRVPRNVERHEARSLAMQVCSNPISPITTGNRFSSAAKATTCSHRSLPITPGGW
ncbi:MAG: hypothetical protein R2839_09835 [Thermomicrobiales bacterium]